MTTTVKWNLSDKEAAEDGMGDNHAPKLVLCARDRAMEGDVTIIPEGEDAPPVRRVLPHHHSHNPPRTSGHVTYKNPDEKRMDTKPLVAALKELDINLQKSIDRVAQAGELGGSGGGGGGNGVGGGGGPVGVGGITDSIGILPPINPTGGVSTYHRNDKVRKLEDCLLWIFW